MTCRDKHWFIDGTDRCWLCGEHNPRKRRHKKLKNDIHNELQTALNQAIKETK